VVSLVFLSGCLVDDSVKRYPSSVRIDVDYDLLAEFIKIDRDKFDDAVKDLNIKCYGVNKTSLYEVVNWYKDRNSDWDVYKSQNQNGFGYNGEVYFWTKMLWGKGVAVVEGVAIKQLTGYDTIIITSHGLLPSYNEYLNQ